MKNSTKQLGQPKNEDNKLAHSEQAHLLSEYLQNTILRPSAIIGASTLLIIGNIYLIYASAKFGYNFGAVVSFWLFVGGYILGLLTELLYKTYKKHSH